MEVRYDIINNACSVYILKSDKWSWFYGGLTENLTKRINAHNKKKVRSTKNFTPLKLVYSKELEKRIDARDYEKFLKIRSNKEKLIKSLRVI